MKNIRVGIIGGTGLGDVLLKEGGGESVEVETPFGPPSSRPILADWHGVEVVFLSRHGQGHRFSPGAVPYRANIWALKQLGVSAIIASGATGSLREDFEPGQLVLCDQVIDRTCRRDSTFFDQGLAVHAEFADPFCPWLRKLLAEAGQRLDTTVHHAGTYVCMEGPQFSTRAESNMHRQWGGDLIGMTCMPEAKLAREAEMCYALVAFPTDYDCWRPAKGYRKDHLSAPGKEALLREILNNLQAATANAVTLIQETLKLSDKGAAKILVALPDCTCRSALKMAIWSDKGSLHPSVRKRLDLLIGRYFIDE